MPQKIKRWPILYKKAKNGKIQQWEIWTSGSTIKTRAGQVGGKLTESSDPILEGKNIGRSNETTPEEQAIAEAQSKYQKKLDQGHIFNMEDALEDKVSDSVGGGFFPMLAHSYDKRGKEIKFPCYIQPKLDGLRAPYENGFFSRSRKPFKTMKHLHDELIAAGLEDVQLDGELYHHELRNDFEEIVSAIKRASSENPNTQKVQYHIYDTPMNADFSLRLDKLRQIFKGRIGNSTKIKLVETRLVRDKDEMMKVYADFMEQGYEGAMVRNMSGAYEYDSRSINLQKLKVFEDDEFEITGIEEGRGALKGHVGAFILAVDDDYGRRLFRAKMKGTGITKFLKECFEDSSLWQGKWMRVQYQGWTRKEALPRFPVAMGMREAE